MEVISAWEIYWVMQLDTIRGLLISGAAAGGAAAMVVFIGAPFIFDDDFVEKRWRKFFIGVPIFLVSVFGPLYAFTPSTRTMAAIIVIPAIANNEAIQAEAGEIYTLAKDALRKAVADDASAKEVE